MISRRAFLSLAGASALARPTFAVRSTQSGPAIDAARLRNRLERLSYHGRPPGGTFADGVNRVAYSVADLTARAWIIDEIKGMDVVPRLDAAIRNCRRSCSDRTSTPCRRAATSTAISARSRRSK